MLAPTSWMKSTSSSTEQSHQRVRVIDHLGFPDLRRADRDAQLFMQLPAQGLLDRLTRFKFNPHFPVNTLKIMRLAVAAQALGCGTKTIDVMYSAMWEQARNMDDPDEIAAVLGEASLDGPALLARAQDPEVKARLAANTQSAFERGAFGSPSFFVGDQLFFGKDRLREVEEEIVRQRSEP